MATLAERVARPRVLISGHLPPPMGNIAAFYQGLLASSLPDRVDLRFVRTTTRKHPPVASGQATGPNGFSALWDCARFARAALRQRPQIAHIGTGHGISFLKHSLCVFVSRLLGIRVLLHPHCSFAAFYTGRSAGWRWYIRQVLRLCDGIVTLSPHWEPLRELVPTCRIYHLSNAIDRAPYAQVARDHMITSEDAAPLRVLFMGQLGKAEGSDDLVEAARVLQSTGDAVHFDVVGTGQNPAESRSLQERIERDGLEERIRLHAAASGAGKLTRLQHAQVLVYPSQHDGQTMTVLEAMACAMPIVAIRGDAAPDLVIEGFNGLLVDRGQPEQLAATIRRLARNDDLRHSLGIHSYQLVLERFDMEHRVQQLVDIYRATLVRGSGQGTAPRSKA